MSPPNEVQAHLPTGGPNSLHERARTWLLLASGVVLQTVIYKGLYGIDRFFLKEIKNVMFLIKSTYLIALLYSLLFARVSGRFEAFSAS